MRRRIEQSKGGRWEVPADYVDELIAAARNETEGEFQKGWPMLDVHRRLSLVGTPGLKDKHHDL